MAKYRIIRHWISGEPIDQSDFDTVEEMLELPIIKEVMQKPNFSRLGWQSWYCMPSSLSHYSSWDIMVEFVDGSSERICNINTIDKVCNINDMKDLQLLEVPQQRFESLISAPSLVSQKKK